MTTTYKFKVGYTKLGDAYEPSSVTINVRDVDTDTLLVTSGVAILSAVEPGGANYSYTGADGLDLVGMFHTDDATVDQKDLRSYTPSQIYKLDAPISGIAAAVWAALTSTLTIVGSIGKLLVDRIDAAISSRATPPDVVTSVAVSATVAAAVSTGSLAIEAGYTFRQQVSSTILQDLSTATKLWMAVKNKSRDDLTSMIFIEKTDGLTRVNGAAYDTPAHGSLIVTGSSGAWLIDIYIDEIASGLLFGINGTYSAGLKAQIGNDEVAVWEGDNNATIFDGVVRTT